MSSLKLRLILFSRSTIKEIILMSKKLLAATLITGVVALAAPGIGIAEPTPASTQTEVEVEKADGFLETAEALAKGTGARIKEAWESKFGADARIKELQAVNDGLKKELLEIRRKLNENRVTDAVQLSEAKSCVMVIGNFLDMNVEGH